MKKSAGWRRFCFVLCLMVTPVVYGDYIIGSYTNTTAMGNGADAELREVNALDSSAGTNQDIRCRWQPSGPRNEVIALRFDLTGFNLEDISNAKLGLMNHRTNSAHLLHYYGVKAGAVGLDNDPAAYYYTNGTPPHYTATNWDELAFSVLAADSGDPGLLRFSTMPGLEYDGNAATKGISATNTQDLGSQTMNNSAKGTLVIFSGGLTDFLNHYPDHLVTILVASDTDGSGQKRFGSKETTALDSGTPAGVAGDFAPRLMFDVVCKSAAIAVPPVSTNIPVGGSATFTVTAGPGSGRTYQWQVSTNNGDTFSDLNGQTNASFTTNAVPAAANASQWRCRVGAICDGSSVTSPPAELIVGDSAPIIGQQPGSQTVTVGSLATFSVAAYGTPPLSYQWYFNTNTLLAGATNASLVLTNVQTNHAGVYAVVVTNRFGAVTSAAAVLTVIIPPNPPLPDIPTNIFNVTNYGAVSDGVTTNTTAIQAAINAAANAGGGIVLVPAAANAFLCGPLVLSSRINLQIAGGALLRMLPLTSYPGSTNSPSPFISGNTLHDVAITGQGAIDGQGLAWWRALEANSGITRPNMINLPHSTRVLIENVTLSNSPSPFISLKGKGGNITIQGITVLAPPSSGTVNPSHNTDAIDLAETNAVIRNCYLSTGDDNLAVGSSASVSCDILVTNCTLGDGHGISIGSYTSGGVSNLTVVDCTFDGTDNGIRMKSDNDRGGIVQNLSYSNLRMTNIRYLPIVIYGYYTSVGTPLGITPDTAAAQPVAAVSTTTPIWRNIIFSNVTATVSTSYGQAGLIWGRTELQASNITLVNVNITAPNGFDLYNVNGIRIIDSQIQPTISGQKDFTLFNAQLTLSNSTPGSIATTLDGLTSTNSLALFNADVSLNDPTIFGANPVGLTGSTVQEAGQLALPGTTVLNFGVGTNPVLMNVAGDLSFASNPLNVADGGGFNTGIYTLFTYAGNLNGSPVLGNIPAGFVCTLTTNLAGEINLLSAAGTNDNNLIVTVPRQAREGDGLLPSAGRLGITAPLSSNLVVHLASSNTNKLVVPPTVEVPAGHTLVDFDLAIVDNDQADGTLPAVLTAGAANFAGDSAQMTVMDNDVHQFVISAVASQQSAGMPFAVSITALDLDGNAIPTYQWPIRLAATGDHGPNPVHPTNVSAWIGGIWIGNVRVDAVDTNVRLVAADELGHSVTGNVFTVQSGPLDHLAFDTVPSPQHQDVPFPVTITARDAGNNLATNFNGTATVWAFSPVSNVVFSSDFEEGLDGFTVDNAVGRTNGAGDGLWHLSTGQATNDDHSAFHSLYYGRGEDLSGGGDYFTGGTNEGVVTSPVIDLTGQTPPLTLWFNHFLSIQDNILDYAYLEISQGGSDFVPLASFSSANAWTPAGVDLSSYAGSQIQFRFHFLSTDQYTGYEGWYVDDVRIENGNAAVGVELAPTIPVTFAGGQGTGTVTVLEAYPNVVLSADDGEGHVGESSPFAVQADADLAVSLYTSPSTNQAGNNLIYVVFVDNNGPERASFVTLTDPLPHDVTFNSVQLSQGTYDFNNYNRTLTCSFGSLDSGDLAIAVITVTPEVRMILTNTVTAWTGAVDTNQANNRATAATTILGEGILQVGGQDFLPTGPAGGGFNPDSQYYTLYNAGRAELEWSADTSAPWLSLSATNGTLLPFNSSNILVSLNAQTAGLPIGVYSNRVAFTNLTNGQYDADFGVMLTTINPLTVSDSALPDGNGNGWIDPNECNGLYLVIQNNRAVPVMGIHATLATTTPGVSIAQGSSPYPDLQPGESASNTVPFYLSTAPGFVCGDAPNLLLNLTSSSGSGVAGYTLPPAGANYVISQYTGAVIVTGTNDTGNHCDDCVTTINLPFPYQFYGQIFSNAALSANGNLQFTSYSGAYGSVCLPSGLYNIIYAHWTDLYTGDTPSNQGIFTSISGSAPDRIFNIEWQARFCCTNGAPDLNFEIRLYENQQRFDIIYGNVNGNGVRATVGVQGNPEDFTQFECHTGVLTNGLGLAFSIPPCLDGGGGCNASGSPLVLSDVGIVSDSLEFRITGEPQQTVVLECSADLLNWMPLTTNLLGAEPLIFIDDGWTNSPNRFYRARLQ